MRLSDKRKPTTILTKMRDRATTRRHARTVPKVSVPFKGRDMETGRAITRAWLSQLDGIEIVDNGVVFKRGKEIVALVQDDDLTTALERGVAFGLTSHPNAA